MVQDAGLHPIEAGKKGDDLEAGLFASIKCRILA